LSPENKDLIALAFISIFVAVSFFMFSTPATTNGDNFIAYFASFCMLVFPVTLLKISQIFKKEEVLNNGS